jgi:hypothetical protein
MNELLEKTMTSTDKHYEKQETHIEVLAATLEQTMMTTDKHDEKQETHVKLLTATNNDFNW